MTIDTSGNWWIGTEPEDIKSFLDAYTAEEYPSDEFRLAKCKCGSIAFVLEADDEEGAAIRKCVSCKEEHFICDSEEYWADSNPETCSCFECGSKETNVGVGFSLYDDRRAVRWLYIGVRCNNCGILGCFAGWKVGYEPSLQLMDNV
ncbi:hypothetical protein KKF84_07465 [Myxococcota bacterium]|nr:hypothetical protein [Myxococcota bacterium]MBU1535142.1 hypothetical protein [Myxococcota bacterium]